MNTAHLFYFYSIPLPKKRVNNQLNIEGKSA